MKHRRILLLLWFLSTNVFVGIYILQYRTRFCSCEKCLSEEDPWFQQRFDKSMKVFLSADHRITEREFMWWKDIYRSNGNITVFYQTVKEVFQVIPSHPNVMNAGSDACVKCAVVGNSVTLRGSGYGPLIDFHDIIMRINDGPVKGFEADVGNKTTHRIMYPESSTHLDDTTRLVMFPFKFKDLEWLPKTLTTGYTGGFRPKLRANKELVMVVNPAFMKYTHETWLENKGRYCSTGFMTLILALHICDEIRVFGFGADKTGNWNHYWSPNLFTVLKTGPHPGDAEYEIIQKLANHKIIQFFPGWGSAPQN